MRIRNSSVVEWPGYARKQKMHDISAAWSRWTLCWNLWTTRFEFKQFRNRAPFPKVLSWIVEFLMLADIVSSWLCFYRLLQNYNLISCSVNHVTDRIYTRGYCYYNKVMFSECNNLWCPLYDVLQSVTSEIDRLFSWDPGEPNLTRYLIDSDETSSKVSLYRSGVEGHWHSSSCF